MPGTTRHCRTRFDESDHEALDYLQQCDENPELLELLTPKELGFLGEALASAYLSDRGWDVLDRNYRCREGEADLVAFDPDRNATVLIEVKTRRAHGQAGDLYPEEAVTKLKQRKYARIVSCYAMEHRHLSCLCFDVIAITLFSGMSAQVEHIRDAFEWDVRS